MDTRVYVIEPADGGGQPRLIRASSRARADRHVSPQFFRSRLASKNDLERLITRGVKVELARETEAAETEALTPD
jgi:hypothetical protein